VAIHVSIHDVSPAWSTEVDDALRMCHRAGAKPALLVVPDFHGRAPLLADPAFCEKLRRLQADGHEVYLHGLRHQSAPRWVRRGRDEGWRGGRIAWLLAQRVVSAGEAELSDVTPAEGRMRVEEGERVLREGGLRLDGYVAPAWSMPPWLLPLLAARGYRYSEDHLRIYDPAAGRSRASVVLNWATRSAARRVSTVAWCRVAKHAVWAFPMRVAIHPGDMRVPAIRREVAAILSWAKALPAAGGGGGGRQGGGRQGGGRQGGGFCDRAEALFSSRPKVASGC
jgi:predicted deacetylase